MISRDRVKVLVLGPEQFLNSYSGPTVHSDGSQAIHHLENCNWHSITQTPSVSPHEASLFINLPQPWPSNSVHRIEALTPAVTPPAVAQLDKLLDESYMWACLSWLKVISVKDIELRLLIEGSVLCANS